MKINSLPRLARWLVVAVAVLLFSGCGGGTSGTGILGDSEMVSSGRVVDSFGNPVVGAVVSVESSQETVVTDETGYFELSGVFPVGDLSFQLGGQILDGAVNNSDTAVSSDSAGVVVTVSIVGERCQSDSGCGPGEYCDLSNNPCGRSAEAGACTAVPEFCPEYYGPVCGCDGVTYSNKCFASAARMSLQMVGECS